MIDNILGTDSIYLRARDMPYNRLVAVLLVLSGKRSVRAPMPT
jgi:hypothetical protein